MVGHGIEIAAKRAGLSGSYQLINNYHLVTTSFLKTFFSFAGCGLILFEFFLTCKG